MSWEPAVIEHQETIESLLRDLNTASKLVDGAATKAKQLEHYLDRSRFVQEAGKTLVQIFELEAELFDLEPTLTYNFLRPSLNAVDLNAALERLLSQAQSIRENTVREFKSYMTDEVASQFALACESGAGSSFAEMWWHQQQKPFFPVVWVYRFLTHERRYMRYQSAKALEERFGVIIWDSERGDVSLEIAEQWFDNWLLLEATEQSAAPE